MFLDKHKCDAVFAGGDSATKICAFYHMFLTRCRSRRRGHSAACAAVGSSSTSPSKCYLSARERSFTWCHTAQTRHFARATYPVSRPAVLCCSAFYTGAPQAESHRGCVGWDFSCLIFIRISLKLIPVPCLDPESLEQAAERLDG